MVKNVKSAVNSRNLMSIGDILSNSWLLFKNNFWAIFLITIIVYVPVNVILYFVPQPESLRDFGWYMRVIQILEFFIGAIALMALAFLVESAVHKKSLGVVDSLKKSISRWPAFISTGLLQGLFLIGLFILLIIPGIIFSVYWSFTGFAVALRSYKWKSAMDYSKSVVYHRWWTVFGYALVFGILNLVISSAFGFVSGFFFGILEQFIFPNIVFDVVSNLIIDIAASFFSVVAVVFFLSLEGSKKVVKK